MPCRTCNFGCSAGARSNWGWNWDFNNQLGYDGIGDGLRMEMVWG